MNAPPIPAAGPEMPRPRRKGRYAFRITAGQCPQCGMDRDGKQTLCSRCRDTQQMWRLKKLAQGKCVECGHDKQNQRWKMCEKCRLKSRVRNRERAQAQSFSARHYPYDDSRHVKTLEF